MLSGSWVFGWRTAGGALGQASATGEIVTLHQLIRLTPEQAAAGLPVRVRGVVVCYDAGWHQLYVNDERESLYFNADDFAAQPKKGDLWRLQERPAAQTSWKTRS